MYYILKLEGNHLKLWNPAKRSFLEERVSPYFSYELAHRVWKRLTVNSRRYNPSFVKVVKVTTFIKLCEDFIFEPKTSYGRGIIRGENHNDKGEIRGANYNDRGHTEVGEVGWMKYTDKLYNNDTLDVEVRPSR
tara:strand:+ start:844 stop:1245 length:402 start_codon:yes stop_codon:yes gene_type:complete